MIQNATKYGLEFTVASIKLMFQNRAAKTNFNMWVILFLFEMFAQFQDYFKITFTYPDQQSQFQN